jgi:hypothetical protein
MEDDDLTTSPISRNLKTSIKMFGLDLEDLLALAMAAVAALIIGQFIFPKAWTVIGLPMNWFCCLAVIGLGVPGLMIFKYGKPRGYLKDLISWKMKPHAYSPLEHDVEIKEPYIVEENDAYPKETDNACSIAPVAPGTGDASICSLFKIREFLDNVIVRMDGSYVAGYRLKGSLTYFGSIAERNDLKSRVDALIRTCPEESMRIQIRYEVNDQIGDTLAQYEAGRNTPFEAAVALDESRVTRWMKRAGSGDFLTRGLTIYFTWSPVVHRRVMAASGGAASKIAPDRESLSIFTKTCITRSLAQHEAIMSQFESILRGVESSMIAADFSPERLTHEEMFLEIQSTLSPFCKVRAKLRKHPLSMRYISAREQLLNSGIRGMTESYIAVDDLLWSTVTLKELPEQTYPGLIRELQTLGFPLTVSTNIVIPNQARVLSVYKRRHKKMLAAQTDVRGNFRLDMSAQVAAADLGDIQSSIMGSSTKACNVSVTIAFRTSLPFATAAQCEAAEQEIADRREHIMHVISRMDGATGLPESGWAQVRTLIGTLPGQAEADNREMEILSCHAADLAPVEMPYAGTPRSPMMLFPTPYRQLLPFSMFDPSMENANAIIAATSGTGKSMLVQAMLLAAGRQGVNVSILERGDSYAQTVRYMGGRTITMSLDSPWAINPFDFEPGMKELTNDHRSFLVNLIRHMIGDSTQSDVELLNSVIEVSIKSAYERASMRAVPIPTLKDVRDSLSHFIDRNKEEVVEREAHIAAIKLRSWCDDGIYANLFDRQTTVDMSVKWLYFNVEKLKDDPKLETAMSLVVAYATTKRAEGTTRCITVLDECWSLLQIEFLGQVVEQLFRTARKRGACVWGISQAVEDFTGTLDKPNRIGAAILATTAVRLIGRQKGNIDVLRAFLHLSPAAVEHIKNLGMTEKGKRSEFVLAVGEQSSATHSIYVELDPTEYWLATSYPRERKYRVWWLSTHATVDFGAAIRLLAAKFPNGLASEPDLPEEVSGEVDRATAPPEPDYSLALGSSAANAKRGSKVKEESFSIFPELIRAQQRGINHDTV